MKKLHLLLLMLLCTPFIYAQSINKLIDQYKDKQGVVYQNIDKDMLKSVASLNKELSTVDQVIVLSFDDCAPELIKKFSDDIRDVKVDKEYSTLIKTSEDDEYVHILSKTVDGKIVGLIILQSESDEANLVWVKGTGLSMDSMNFMK